MLKKLVLIFLFLISLCILPTTAITLNSTTYAHTYDAYIGGESLAIGTFNYPVRFMVWNTTGTSDTSGNIYFGADILQKNYNDIAVSDELDNLIPYIIKPMNSTTAECWVMIPYVNNSDFGAMIKFWYGNATINSEENMSAMFSNPDVNITNPSFEDATGWTFSGGTGATSYFPDSKWKTYGSYAINQSCFVNGGGSWGSYQRQSVTFPADNYTIIFDNRRNAAVGPITYYIKVNSISVYSSAQGAVIYYNNETSEFSGGGTYNVDMGLSFPGTLGTRGSYIAFDALRFMNETMYSKYSSPEIDYLVFPNPNFTATPLTTIVGENVVFTGIDNGIPIITWEWDFGDLFFSYTQNTTHSYLTAGAYDVNLTAQNIVGTDYELKTNYIVVKNVITASFTTTDTTYGISENITFTDTSVSLNITNYTWNFGDGSTSTLQNPIHSYKFGGYYNVTLNITDSYGTLWENSSEVTSQFKIMDEIATPISTESFDDTVSWYLDVVDEPTYITSDEDGTHIFVGTSAGNIFGFNTAGTQIWQATIQNESEILKVVTSDTGDKCIAISSGGSILMLNGADGSFINQFNYTPTSGQIYDIAASRDASNIIVTYADAAYFFINDALTQIITPAYGNWNQVKVTGDGDIMVFSQVGNSSVLSYNLTSPTTYEYADIKSFGATILLLSASEGGTWFGVATANNGYHQYLTPEIATFGTTTTLTPSNTPVTALRISNSAGFSALGGGQILDVFRHDNTQVGTYTTGGDVNNVDISIKNGLWATGGSLDGVVYIFSKEDSSSWYLVYSSESFEPVSAIAMTWRGEYVVAGRIDGTITLYSTSAIDGTEEEEDDDTFDIIGTCFKDGMRYSGQTVTIYQSETGGTYTWVLSSTVITDDLGAFTIEVTQGMSYKYVLNAGEAEIIAVADSSRPYITIMYSTMGLTYAYEYDAEIIGSNIVVSYTDDAVAKSVKIEIIDMYTKTIVYSHTFTDTDTVNINYAIDTDLTRTYKINFDIVRYNNVAVRGQRIVSTDFEFSISLPGVPDTFIINIIFLVFIMLFAGLFSYAHAEKGALALAGVTLILWYTQLITISFVVVAIAFVLALASVLTSGTSSR